MSHETKLYISLFHGRTSPDEKIGDWGFDGPVIGPVAVSWTYGSVRVHDTLYTSFEFLPTKEDFVAYDGKYYGDFEIWIEDDPLVKITVEGGKRPVHSFQEFSDNVAKMKLKAN